MFMTFGFEELINRVVGKMLVEHPDNFIISYSNINFPHGVVHIDSNFLGKHRKVKFCFDYNKSKVMELSVQEMCGVVSTRHIFVDDNASDVFDYIMSVLMSKDD